MRIQVSNLWLGVLLTLCCVGVAYGQNATGSISGSVTDAQGAVVPNAGLVVTNKATGVERKLTTNNEGDYTVENLQPGEYEIQVEVKGFKSSVLNANVHVGSTARGDVVLQVGSGVAATVNVTGEAQLLNTTDTVVGGIVSRERIENLPLNGRSFLSVAGLEPGVNVNYAANSGAGNPNNFFQVSVGGAPQQMTVITVDGSRVNDRVTGGTSQNFSSETVQEFQISTLGFDLSSGTVSAGVVNIVTRGGGNEFHGGAFYFFRDHNMSAFTGFKRPTELRANGLPQNILCVNPTSNACKRALDPYFSRKQYGGTFGGPIKKDKLFFFFNFERNDQVGANAITFDDATLGGFNHIAQQPFKANLANLRLDYTLSQKHTVFFRAGVDSNQSVSGGNTLESSWIASSNFAYQLQMGMTSVLNSTLVNDLRVSFSYFRNTLLAPSQAQCESISGSSAFCFGLNGVRATLNGVTFGNNINIPQDRHPRTYQFTDNVNWTHGNHRVRFGGNLEHVYDHGTWNQNFKGSFSTFSPAQVLAASPTLYAALPAGLKPGGTATIADLLKLPVNGTVTIGIGDPSQPARPFNTDQVLRNNNYRFYAQDAWQMRPGLTVNYGLGWSFEDNVLYHDLTLPQYLAPLFPAGNLGRTIAQRWLNFDPAVGFAYAAGKGQKTVIRASAGLHHISPNVGFFKLNNRILFGPAGNGLGSFVGTGLQNPNSPTPCGSLPAPNAARGCLTFTAAGWANPGGFFTAQDMINNLTLFRAQLAAANPFNGTNLATRGINITKSVQGGQGLDAIYDNDSARFPYTIQVDVGVQQEVKRNLSVSVDYVMRRGVGFGAFELMFPDLNRWNRFSDYTLGNGSIALGGPAFNGVTVATTRNPVIPACVGAQAASPTAQCSLGPIQYGSPSILSRYQSLQVKVDKRFSQGYQFTGAYALTKYTSFGSLSNANNLFEGFGAVGGSPRHRFTFSGIWDVPKYKGEQRLLRSVVNGWQLSSIVQMQSGQRNSVTLGLLDHDGDGYFTYRLPGTTVSSFGHSLNANDIRQLVAQYNATIPAAANVAVRDIPKGPLRDAAGTPFPFLVLPDKFSSGDSFISHDLRLTRKISITEKVKLSLIAEGFNIFNIANLTGFSGSVQAMGRPAVTGGTPTLPASGLTFGQPSGRVNATFGSGGPRAFQVAARLAF